MYPADYGFVPDTLSKDGDPLDALVLVADPTFPGCVVRARILGVFFMRDEAGLDAKLLTVLEHDPQWDQADDIEDVPDHLLNEIEHFFSIYKDLEPEKSTDVMGFEGARRRDRELEACREAFPVRTPGTIERTSHAVSTRGSTSTVDRYHALRDRIDAGQERDAFGALADFYTEDAVYIDGAWGRLEGVTSSPSGWSTRWWAWRTGSFPSNSPRSRGTTSW